MLAGRFQPGKHPVMMLSNANCLLVLQLHTQPRTLERLIFSLHLSKKANWSISCWEYSHHFFCCSEGQEENRKRSKFYKEHFMFWRMKRPCRNVPVHLSTVCDIYLFIYLFIYWYIDLEHRREHCEWKNEFLQAHKVFVETFILTQIIKIVFVCHSQHKHTIITVTVFSVWIHLTPDTC